MNIFCKKKSIRKEKVLAMGREKYIAVKIDSCTALQLALIKLPFSEDHS